MNTTGIVRRIDDLGRVVIPKEIRKSLRIKDGESLEIMVSDDKIILKKYSSIEDMYMLLNNLIISVNKIINKNIIIFDREKIICSTGNYTSELRGKRISENLYDLMINTKTNYSGNSMLFVDDEKNTYNYIFSSIIPNGDVVGGVLIFSDQEITEKDKLFLNLIIDFFTKSIEE